MNYRYLLIFNCKEVQKIKGKQLRFIFRCLPTSKTTWSATGDLVWSFDERLVRFMTGELPKSTPSDGDLFLTEEEFAKFQADNITIFL